MNTDSLIHFSFCFTSFLVLYETEDLKTKEYLRKGNYNVAKWFNEKKNTNFQGFRVFDLALYPKSKIRKSWRVFSYLNC